ncbi:MAG: homoserine dehydrogenase [Propionibacteriaceae bacterium]|jgi:homoserine dehydrogenase|nr:homoserine dehydrogenase [Propionibacteriaceae bacterium]
MDLPVPAPLRVALLGCGVVGSQVARLLLESPRDLEARTGRRLALVGIGVRHPKAERPGIDPALLTGDLAALAAGADIVVEAIGGIEPARSLILAAIAAGASVVTANKELLAACGPELNAAAQKAGVDLYFEAAVAGAIPIVRPLRESLVGDEITTVMGIVNGTTNYILDQMTTDGLSFSAALVQAQALGFAEADPTADIDGYDAAAKASIIASLAFHTEVAGADVHREGIAAVTDEDIKAAASLGYVVKLLAVATLVGGGERVSVRVHPAMVPADHPLAMVRGGYNAVFVESRNAGRLMFLGPGAGGAPTASAVMGDLVTVARNRNRGTYGPAPTPYTHRPVAPIADAVTSYYLSLPVHDAPGVLAKVASVFASHDVSIAAVRQTQLPDQPGAALLGIMTHAARDGEVHDTIAELKTDGRAVIGQIRHMRVEGV